MKRDDIKDAILYTCGQKELSIRITLFDKSVYQIAIDPINQDYITFKEWCCNNKPEIHDVCS